MKTFIVVCGRGAVSGKLRNHWCDFGAKLKRFSFAKKKRLSSNTQFRAVLAQKRRISDGLLVLYIAKNDCGYSRLGISVGKSCGGAVLRNRLKRLLREAFRQNRQQIPQGFDYVVMISPKWPGERRDRVELKKAVMHLTFEEVEISLVTLAIKAADKSS